VHKVDFLKVIVIASLPMLLNCASNSGPESAGQAGVKVDKTWAAGMRGMADSLQRLMPFVFSRQEFSDPKNKSEIHDRIAQFAAGVAEVPKHAGEKMLGKDPMVQFSIARLKSNSRQALQAFDEGHFEFSRSVLRENMGLCFNCHSSQQFGPEDNFSKESLGATNFRIYPSERVDYYVATRQFDKATELLETVLKSPASVDDPHEQLDSLRKYLSLEVRVKEDPRRAISVVQTFLTQKDLPYFIAADAQVWLKSLKEWQHEKKSKASGLTRAQNLMHAARTRQSDGSMQSGFIDFLRASNLLHEGLRSLKDGKDKAKYYEMLGQSYEALSDVGIWDLPEYYYEACVRSAPKTDEAKRCYKDLEKSIVLGFSGSAGVFIPKDERDRLNELKSLAGLTTVDDHSDSSTKIK
jgi:hypothetical protein